MKSFFVNVNGEDIKVEIPDQDSSGFWQTALINGQEIKYNLDETHILLTDASYYISYKYNNYGDLEGINFNNNILIPVKIEGHRRRNGNKKNKNNKTIGREEGKIYAPLNGQIIKLFFKKGDSVKRGEKVLILESMKMENEIVSPISGIVNKIEAEEGKIVSAGQLLFVITNAINDYF